MSESHPLQVVAENLWLQHFPQRLLGTELGRVVTIIRLKSGDLVIHSTAPFTPADVQAIGALGHPRWLVEGTLAHDTFALPAKTAFPGIPLLAPPGFSESAKVPATVLVPAPPEWAGELLVQEILGVTTVREHVFFHASSRTLIVADLVFNFNGHGNPWEQLFRRRVLGLRVQPGVARDFKTAVREKAAFRASMAKIMEWDFDRIICGHKEMVPADGKRRLQAALSEAGL